MKKLIFIMTLILIFNSIVCFAQEPSPEAKSVMGAICRNLGDLKDLTKIKGDVTHSTAYRDYKNIKKWVNQNLDKLNSIDPSLINSDYKIWKVPFNKRIADARIIMAKNDKILDTIPNSDALSLIDQAIYFCESGKQSLKDKNVKSENIKDFYEYYTSMKSKAEKLDKKVLTFRNNEISDCTKNFVEPFNNLLKKEKEITTLAIEQRNVEIHNKNSIALKKANDEYNVLLDDAHRYGFSDVYTNGIVSLIEDIGYGDFDQDKLAKMMIVAASEDYDFKMQSLTDDYAFYVNLETQNITQVALLREKGKTYMQGSELMDTYFKYIGIEEFVNSSGQHFQIVVLKAVH